jgi:hypothetical protein
MKVERALLMGGFWDGAIEELGEREVLPPMISRIALSNKQMEELSKRPDGIYPAPRVEYLKTKRTRADGCVIYVLKGADL